MSTFEKLAIARNCTMFFCGCPCCDFLQTASLMLLVDANHIHAHSREYTLA